MSQIPEGQKSNIEGHRSSDIIFKRPGFRGHRWGSKVNGSTGLDEYSKVNKRSKTKGCRYKKMRGQR